MCGDGALPPSLGFTHTGKRFDTTATEIIMAIDIRTIANGSIAKTCRLENWLRASGQLHAR
jgi:hypothetical protein